jgi:hypothetical protein
MNWSSEPLFAAGQASRMRNNIAGAVEGLFREAARKAARLKG